MPQPHFTSDHPRLLPIYNAMRELGLDDGILSFEAVSALAVQLSEPNGAVETDYSLELELLLSAINFEFDSAPGGQLPMIIIRSHGAGHDFGNGLSSGWTTSPVPAGGWRQRPTDTVDQVHLAALACSDSYWDLMPGRLKTVSAIEKWAPELFNVDSIADLPRNRAYLRAQLEKLVGDLVR